MSKLVREKGEKIGLEKGEKIGIEKGKKLGVEEATLETAQKMKREGMATEMIKKITGIDV